jgi:DNA-binding LacI/PurR family transcriptional regulator
MIHRKAATLRDVANRAAVSTATVRRVLTNEGYVAPATRDAVEAALVATDYRPNAVAQSLRRQHTAVIGHLLYAVSPNPFYAQVAVGAAQEALQRGYSILAFDGHGSAARERLGVETFIRRQVDAILFTTPVSIDNVRLAVEIGMPVVQVERPTRAPSSVVLVDNYAGAVQATEHLIGLGHTQIAFMGANFEQDPTLAQPVLEGQRLDGFLDTMRRHGLPICPDWIALGQYYSLEGERTPGDGYRFMQSFLDHAPRPTAVFAACDFMAAGACQAVYTSGLRVPDDISIVGFDDTLAPYLAPPLTTVAQPMQAIGRAAVELAIAEIESGGEHHSHQTRRLSMQWVVRASTAAPKPARSS